MAIVIIANSLCCNASSVQLNSLRVFSASIAIRSLFSVGKNFSSPDCNVSVVDCTVSMVIGTGVIGMHVSPGIVFPTQISLGMHMPPHISLGMCVSWIAVPQHTSVF